MALVQERFLPASLGRQAQAFLRVCSFIIEIAPKRAAGRFCILPSCSTSRPIIAIRSPIPIWCSFRERSERNAASLNGRAA
jgi:hypothetical protein